MIDLNTINTFLTGVTIGLLISYSLIYYLYIKKPKRIKNKGEDYKDYE